MKKVTGFIIQLGKSSKDQVDKFKFLDLYYYMKTCGGSIIFNLMK